MSLSDFYDSTPREVVAVVNASAWRSDRAYRDGLRVAWHVAMLGRAKKLPDLAEVMPPSFDQLQALRRGDATVDYRGRPKPTPEQEWELWMAIMTKANAQHAQRVAAGLEPATEAPKDS